MRKTILCFGDSNTYGYAPTGGRYGEDVRWTGRLAALLGPEYRIIEEGLNGRTICFDDPVEGGHKSGLEYMPACMMSHSPLDLVIVMLGGNDAQTRFGMSAMMIAEAMLHFLKKMRLYALNAQGDSAKILLAAPPLIGEGVAKCRYGQCFGPDSVEKMRQLSGEYKRLSRLMHCEFLDLAPVAEISPIDSLHLTPSGHEAVARALEDKIREILS